MCYCLFNPNAGDYSGLTTFQPRVTFRYRAQPFHSEILKCQQQRPQVATGNFHVVRRKGTTQELRIFGMVVSMCRQAHDASRCQHTSADDTVRLLVSDFIIRFQVGPDEPSQERTATW